MRWLIILLLYSQTLLSQDFKDGISVVQFNASFLSENAISLEPIRDAETQLLLMGKHPDVFEREKIVFCEDCGKDKVHYLEENDFRHTEKDHWVCSHHSGEEA